MTTPALTAAATAPGTASRRLTAVAVLLALTFVTGILVLAATSQSSRLMVGRAPTADDEIVLDVSTALAQGIRLGESVRLQDPQSGTFRVVGLVGPGDGAPNASFVPAALGGVLVLAGLVVAGDPIVRPRTLP